MSSSNPLRAATRGNRRPRMSLAALLLTLAAAGAQALPEDRNQPIHITADKAVRDEKQGFTVYEGNVHMQQGTLEIDANRITVYHEVLEADRILAEGNPAHLQQKPEPGKGLMHARGRTIEYFKGEERVLLRRNASIEQDGSRVTGESIEYFIEKQLIRADSATTESKPGESNGRVEVVIPANAVKGTDDQGESGSDNASGEPDSAAAKAQED